MSTSKNLVDIWELYNSKVLNEKAPAKQAAKMTTKKGPGPVDLNSPKAKDIQNKDTTGPAEADGFGNEPVDVRNPKHKKINAYNISNLSFGENFDQNIEKTSKDKINNNMKSIFDKLFEEVMGNEDAADLQALGVDTEGQGHEDMEGGEGEEMTHAEIIESLEKVLAALKKHAEGDEAGAQSEMGDETSDEDGEMMKSEEDEENSDDADEEDSEEEDDMKVKKESSGIQYKIKNGMDFDGKEVPESDGLGLTKHNNIELKGKTKTLSSKGKGPGEGKIKAAMDFDGKEVPESDGMGMTKHNNIEVKSKIKGKNQEFFGV